MLRSAHKSRTLGRGLSSSSARVVVIGAGLSGLAVAARLVSAGQDVLVLEGSGRAGGQIHTLREGRLVVELGAEGFVARGVAVPALAQLLGIQGSLVEQLSTDTYAVDGSGLTLLPPGEAARRLGFQVPAEELGRGIRSFALGMGELVDALLTRVGSQRLRLGAEVSALRRTPEGLQVLLADGQREAARAVVLAAPARLAAGLLEPLGVAESAPLAMAPLMSNVSVNLLYASTQFQNYPAGSGLIFPQSFADVGLRALSLVDHKFSGRAPAGQALLRVFFRPVGDALTVWTDERFATEAAQAIGRVLPVQGAPARTWVSRWANALPVFSHEHRARAAALDVALQPLGIHVVGSAFHGAGIDAAVGSAEIVAARLGA
jgi:protoporphyrinogen/coproporphyrinogen III oxidase